MDRTAPDLPCDAGEMGADDLLHDQYLCLLAARLLSKRRGGSRLQVVDLPDVRERTREAIELVAKDDLGELAFEHTELESFPDQIRGGARLRNLFPDFEVAAKVPDDSQFQLAIEPHAIDGVTDLAQARSEVVAWVEQIAPTLEVGSPRTAPRHVAVGRPPDVPFEVRLLRWPRDVSSAAAGRVRLVWATPRELEALRVERTTTALRRKTEKLEAARGSNTATCLVLENRDISLANAWLITDALRAAASDHVFELPDEIVLIDTVAAPMAWLLFERQAWFPEVPDSGIHHLA